MINCILLEDDKRRWREYKPYLEDDFKDEINLLNQDFLPAFENMQEFVSGNIHQTSLIIADISLDQESPNDERRWSPQLILNVLENEVIYELVNRRGLMIAFMTAFIEDQYSDQIETEFHRLFNSNYVHKTAIRKGEFTNDLRKVLQGFRETFQQTNDGNWIKMNLLNYYLLNVRETIFPYQLRNRDEIYLHQIAALELNGDREGFIWYENETRKIVNSLFAANEDGISNLFRLFLINNGRDKTIRDQFEAVADSAHFIHICDQPFRLINVRKNWLYCGRDCGHGKIFTLAGEDLEMEGTFDTYNNWIKKDENIFFNKCEAN